MPPDAVAQLVGTPRYAPSPIGRGGSARTKRMMHLALNTAVLEQRTGRIFRPGDRLRVNGVEYEVVSWDPVTNTGNMSARLSLDTIGTYLAGSGYG